MTAATYKTEECAELFGVSTWTLYESVRRGDCPIEPIRVGRRLVWAKAKVDAVLGLEPLDESAATPGASHGHDEGPVTTTGPIAIPSSTPASATAPRPSGRRCA
jgi:predicted DNA-binding transcriptional regulator AlpA